MGRASHPLVAGEPRAAHGCMGNSHGLRVMRALGRTDSQVDTEVS